MLNELYYSEEELGLFNPAFTGYVLYASIREFLRFKPDGMHCALFFIIIPMAMNQSISTQLPRSFKTPIASWVSENEGLLSDFAEQACAYNSIVISAISFLLERELITINEDGEFMLGENKIVKNPVLFKKSDNMTGVLRASKMLGKWFSHAPSTETIFSQMGVRP